MSCAPLPDDVPGGVRRALDVWHRVECTIAVFAFAAITALLLADVLGRELFAPLLRRLGADVGAGGIFGAQKVAIYLLVVGTYVGIGIATVAGTHLVPRVGFGWIPARWGPAMDRVADALTGVVLLIAGGYGVHLVQASFVADVRMPSLGWSLWPVQLVVPLGLWSAALRYVAFAAWPDLRPKPPEVNE